MRPTLAVVVDELPPSPEGGYEATSRMIADELLLWLQGQFETSSSPSDQIIAGTSRRGLVAADVAFRRPDRIGKVISLSGSYYWRPNGNVAPEWFTARLAESDRRAVDLYVAVGLLEMVITQQNPGHVMLSTNRHLRNALTAKGYAIRYGHLPTH